MILQLLIAGQLRGLPREDLNILHVTVRLRVISTVIAAVLAAGVILGRRAAGRLFGADGRPALPGQHGRHRPRFTAGSLSSSSFEPGATNLWSHGAFALFSVHAGNCHHATSVR